MYIKCMYKAGDETSINFRYHAYSISCISRMYGCILVVDAKSILQLVHKQAQIVEAVMSA